MIGQEQNGLITSKLNNMKNIKIHCGYSNPLNYPVFKYESFYSEQQIDLFNKEYLKDDVKLFTNSPYILNYLNLLIFNNVIDYNSLEVIFHNENGSNQDLKIQRQDLINTKYHSDTVNFIYEKYNEIKGMSLLQRASYRWIVNVIKEIQSMYEVDCWLRTIYNCWEGEENIILLKLKFQNKEIDAETICSKLMCKFDDEYYKINPNVSVFIFDDKDIENSFYDDVKEPSEHENQFDIFEYYPYNK